MKILISLILFLGHLSSVSAFAATLDSSEPLKEFEKHLSEDFIHSLEIKCSADEPRYCLELCGKVDSCVVEQIQCRDCLGTSSLLMREVFLNVNELYSAQNEKEWSQDKTIHLLQSRSFITVSAESVFNFYTRFDSTSVKQRFLSLCYEEADLSQWKDVLVILSLDEHLRSKQVVGVMCQGKESFSIRSLRRVDGPHSNDLQLVP